MLAERRLDRLRRQAERAAMVSYERDGRVNDILNDVLRGLGFRGFATGVTFDVDEQTAIISYSHSKSRPQWDDSYTEIPEYIVYSDNPYTAAVKFHGERSNADKNRLIKEKRKVLLRVENELRELENDQ